MSPVPRELKVAGPARSQPHEHGSSPTRADLSLTPAPNPTQSRGAELLVHKLIEARWPQIPSPTSTCSEILDAKGHAQRSARSRRSAGQFPNLRFCLVLSGLPVAGLVATPPSTCLSPLSLPPCPHSSSALPVPLPLRCLWEWPVSVGFSLGLCLSPLTSHLLLRSGRVLLSGCTAPSFLLFFCLCTSPSLYFTAPAFPLLSLSPQLSLGFCPSLSRSLFFSFSI